MAKEKIPYRQRTPRYRLEKYTGRSSRHTCPACGHKNVFARFIDVTTGDYVADDVGRCNREEKCGYSKSVQDENGKDLFVLTSHVKKEYLDNEITHTIDPKYVLKSMTNQHNHFTNFLYSKFNQRIETVDEILHRYMVGSDDLWENSVVFWQLDRDFDVRTGKIMLYNPENLKRVKEPYNHISWIHTPSKENQFGENEDYNLTQCFFGEHLVNNENFTKFGVVESEKTAILCAIMNPDMGWIATGGLQNINEERMLPFKDKKLEFFPDKGKALKIWKDKLKPFMDDYDIKINDSLEKKDFLKEGDDIGDLILYK